jgi:hypothetical protein
LAPPSGRPTAHLNAEDRLFEGANEHPSRIVMIICLRMHRRLVRRPLGSSVRLNRPCGGSFLSVLEFQRQSRAAWLILYMRRLRTHQKLSSECTTRQFSWLLLLAFVPSLSHSIPCPSAPSPERYRCISIWNRTPNHTGFLRRVA